VKLGVIIQARMGSSRLPGKVLRLIAGKPLLAHVTGRLIGLKHQVIVVVATSTQTQDDAIATWCGQTGIICFRGSELDVLDRYFQCAQQFGFNHIVRLTADNPFTDITELDRLIEQHLTQKNDYTHSFGMMPLGIGAEIMTVDALQTSAVEGMAPHHREHVNEFIQENPERFRIGVLDVPASKKAPELRMTVDTIADFDHACRLADICAPEWLSTERAISAC